MLGLEVFASSVPSLLGGLKKASLRDFALLTEFIDQPVCLLARPDPPNGEPLPDELPASAGGFQLSGVVTFSGHRQYASRSEFDIDEARHQVLPGTAVHDKYANLIDAGLAHAWDFAAVQRPPPWLSSAAPTPAIRRRHRAFFDVDLDTHCQLPRASDTRERDGRREKSCASGTTS